MSDWAAEIVADWRERDAEHGNAAFDGPAVRELLDAFERLLAERNHALEASRDKVPRGVAYSMTPIEVADAIDRAVMRGQVMGGHAERVAVLADIEEIFGNGVVRVDDILPKLVQLATRIQRRGDRATEWK